MSILGCLCKFNYFYFAKLRPCSSSTNLIRISLLFNFYCFPTIQPPTHSPGTWVKYQLAISLNDLIFTYISKMVENLNVCYSLFKLGIHIPRQFHNSLQIPLNTIGQSKPASQQIKFLEHQWRTPALSHLPNCQGKLVRMSAKQKSPSRLRRDEYRMSIYNSCKQILELQQKNEDLLMMEDQASSLNETLF